jgi:DNA-binding LytR/AlgR family response regulator
VDLLLLDIHRYAIEAFAIHALDYLLKPIEGARFHEVVKVVKQRKEMEPRWSPRRIYVRFDSTGIFACSIPPS